MRGYQKEKQTTFFALGARGRQFDPDHPDQNI